MRFRRRRAVAFFDSLWMGENRPNLRAMRRQKWLPCAGFGLTSLLCTTSAALAAPPKIQTHMCANGLEVLVVENHSVPLVTIEIAAKNGSMTEPPEYNGLSHLYEHMFFRQTR